MSETDTGKNQSGNGSGTWTQKGQQENDAWKGED